MSNTSVSPVSRCWREVARELGNETSRLRVMELSEELHRALLTELSEELSLALDEQQPSFVARRVTSTKSAGRVLKFPQAKH